MIEYLFKIYSFLFARKIFYRANKFLYMLSLRGMGILNFENKMISGEEHFLKQFLKGVERPIIFDVGANMGDYASLVKDICPTAEVYCFEPHPETFEKLSKKAERYGFKAFNVGCSNENTKLHLYDYAESSVTSHASLYKEVIENIHKSNSRAFMVDIIRLDDFVAEHNVEEIYLLKIDTEGHELKVLEGIQSYLSSRKVKAIHFEFNEMNVESRVFFKDFYDMLSDYLFYRMLPDRIVQLGDYNAILCEIFAFQNIVAIHRDMRDIE